MVKYKMVNDLDNDASKRNFIKKEYEKLEGRVCNATSRTQLALIIADAGSLALMASQLGIDIGILELIATAVNKTLYYETTEQIQVVDFNDGIRLAKEQEKIDREYKVQGIYKAEDSLNRQRKDNESLHEIFEAIKAGRKFTEEEKQKFSKTPEQIKEENARSKHLTISFKFYL
jgi:intracellular sulfur oxidation DsrE/DsrF family protein